MAQPGGPSSAPLATLSMSQALELLVLLGSPGLSSSRNVPLQLSSDHVQPAGKSHADHYSFSGVASVRGSGSSSGLPKGR